MPLYVSAADIHIAIKDAIPEYAPPAFSAACALFGSSDAAITPTKASPITQNTMLQTIPQHISLPTSRLFGGVACSMPQCGHVGAVS
jgi:hypothetical protein